MPMKVVHIMADGTKRDTLKGVVIPYNERTKIFYAQLTEHLKCFEEDTDDDRLDHSDASS